jgi:hypothetical protein
MTYSPIFKIVLFIGFVYTYSSFKLNKNINIDTSLYNSKTQCIISSKNKKSYCGENECIFINNNDKIFNKQLITISPGGYKGFYLLGILTYIKENYNTDNIIFSGASAGAWNSLFMCYKGSDPLSFVYNFLDINIRKAKSLTELQYFFKYKLLSSYKTEDFELEKMFLGVTTFKNFAPVVNIYTDFEDLEDAINCCMASSHIPLITGGLTNRYKNMFSFDGGFSNYPYLDKERIIHISLSMWDELNTNVKQNLLKQSILNIKNFASFFSLSKNNLLELFDNGYNDAKIHKDYFDNLLEPKIDEDTPEF